MLLVHIIFVVGTIVGLLALYAPQIEQWNNKHLLSAGKTNGVFEQDSLEDVEIGEKANTEKLIDAGFTHKQAAAIVSILEKTK